MLNEILASARTPLVDCRSASWPAMPAGCPPSPLVDFRARMSTIMAIAKIVPGKTRIGWIGTGVMGSSMCGHLIAAGYRPRSTTGRASKAKPLVDKGASWADTPKAVAAGLGRGLHDRRLSRATCAR